MIPTNQRERAERYAGAALERQCFELSNTTAERNAALNRSAYGLGQLVGAGLLDRQAVEANLYAAAVSNGYVRKDGAGAARGTIRSGLCRGILRPREFPDRSIGGRPFQPDPAEVERRAELRKRAEEAERADAIRRQKLALAIWEAAIDPRGQLPDHYLRSRALDLPDNIAGRAIRYSAECPFGRGKTLPAMVALLRDVRSGEPKAIHRTGLTDDGRKIGRKMLGDATGAAVMLDAEEAVTTGLAVGEGVESCLAARQLGIRPTWALLSTSGVKNLPVLPGIETLTLLVENDVNGASERACRTVGARWHEARCAVDLVRPRIGKDLNDTLMAEGTAA